MNTTETSQDTYQVDTSHSEVGFRVKHLGITTVKGSFGALEATVQVDTNDLSTLKVTASIDAASINTGTEDRDNHLRSGDFFDVETYPKLTFESTGVQNIQGNNLELLGNLTMRDVTKAIVLKTSFLGAATDPWGNHKVAFEASGEINRKEFGLNWNQVLEAGGLLVAETVKLSLDIQAA